MTDSEKLNNLIAFIKDAEKCYLTQKVSPLTCGKVCAIQDILLFVENELGIPIYNKES